LNGRRSRPRAPELSVRSDGYGEGPSGKEESRRTGQSIEGGGCVKMGHRPEEAAATGALV